MTPSARRFAEAGARFFRLFSLGTTWLAVLAGLATGAGPAPDRPELLGPVLWTLLLGVLFHVYANVANDVLDLPVDRTDPRRGSDPLVRGLVPAPAALLLAFAALAALLAVGTLAAPTALWPLVGAVVLVGCYNLAGKALPVPLVADAVEGAGGGCLVLAGAALAGGPTPVTWWVAGFVLVYLMMVNGLHGAIRDVHNDRQAGARTTAVLAGVEVRAGRVVVPAAVAGWGALLQLALGGLLAGALLAGPPATGAGPAWAVSAGLAGLGFGLSTLALVRAWLARGDLRRAMAAGTWHLVLVPAALLAELAWRLPLWAVGVAVAAYVAPPLLFGAAVRGTPFVLPSTSLPVVAAVAGRPRRQVAAGLWRMTRAGTPLAAAGLAAAGVVIGGGADLPAVAAAVLAMALAVAAANVYNDRCDVGPDTVNAPHRPLVAGTVTGNQADRFVLATTLGLVASAALAGPAAASVAAGLLVLGLAYSLLLRRVAVVGQVAVATLFAAPVLYGGWLSSGLQGAHWVAAALVATYVFARESLKGIPDRAGDRLSGYRTIATAWGVRAALAGFRVAVLVFVAGAVVAALLASRPALYLVAALACAVVPAGRTLWLVRGTPSPAAVDRAIAFSGLVFGLGLLPLLLLA